MANRTRYVRIVAENDFDHMQLTENPACLKPASHMQSQEHSEVMRTVGGEQEIIGELESPKIASAVALGRYTLMALDNVIFEFYLNDVLQTNIRLSLGQDLIPAGLFRPGVMPFGATYNQKFPKLAAAWFDEITYNKVKILFSASAGFDSSRCFIGAYITPSYGNNYDYGHRLKMADGIQHIEMADSSLMSVGNANKKREKAIDLNGLSNMDKIVFESTLANIGRDKDLLVSFEPETGGHNEVVNTYIAKIKDVTEIMGVAHNVNATRYTFRET